MAVKEKGARLRRRPLQGFAPFELAAEGLPFAHAGGADFVGETVASAFEGAPHVPACDGAIWAPTLSKGEELLGLRHVLLAVGDRPAFFDAEVVDGEDVGAAEAEDQKHFNGPGPDAADGDEALDKLFVGELFSLFECGNYSVDGLLREVSHGEDFRAGETGIAEDGLAQLEHLFGRGRSAVAAQGLDAAEDGGGGFAGDGLMGDGFEECLVGRLEVVSVSLEGDGVGDEFGEFLICGGQMTYRGREIEGNRRRHGHVRNRVRQSGGREKSTQRRCWRTERTQRPMRWGYRRSASRLYVTRSYNGLSPEEEIRARTIRESGPFRAWAAPQHFAAV